MKSQYPELVPSFPPVADILDTSLVKERDAATSTKGAPDVAKFDPTQVTKQAAVVVSRKNGDIKFDSGKATFSGTLRYSYVVQAGSDCRDVVGPVAEERPSPMFGVLPCDVHFAVTATKFADPTK